MKDKPKNIVFGGRGNGKMMVAEEWLKTLPKEIQDKVIVVKASDPVPELRGNKLPRIVDYDVIETSGFPWKLWKEFMKR